MAKFGSLPGNLQALFGKTNNWVCDCDFRADEVIQADNDNSNAEGEEEYVGLPGLRDALYE